MQRVYVQGFNSDIDSGAAEDIAPTTVNLPATAAATTIVSASASDTAAGTGARTVEVVGLDADYKMVSETAILNGATPVNLVIHYLRILSVEVLTVGSGGSNAGQLSVKQSSTVIALVDTGLNRTTAAVFTMPEFPRVGRIKGFSGGISNGAASTVKVSLLKKSSTGPWLNLGYLSSTGGLVHQPVDIVLAVGDDVKLVGAVSADNTAVVGGLEFALGSQSELL